MTENEWPFEVIKRGNSELKVGYHPDGRMWCHAICVECGGNCPTIFGIPRGGAGAQAKGVALGEAKGYWIVRRPLQKVRPRTFRGWSYSGYTQSYISDWCKGCGDHLTAIANMLYAREGLDLTDPSNAEYILFRYYAGRAKTAIHKAKRNLKVAYGKV